MPAAWTPSAHNWTKLCSDKRPAGRGVSFVSLSARSCASAFPAGGGTSFTARSPVKMLQNAKYPPGNHAISGGCFFDGRFCLSAESFAMGAFPAAVTFPLLHGGASRDGSSFYTGLLVAAAFCVATVFSPTVPLVVTSAFSAAAPTHSAGCVPISTVLPPRSR